MASQMAGKYMTLYNSMAHAFHIDNETKSKWISIGGQERNPIPISFVATIPDDDSEGESGRRELRIIGNGSAESLDALILPTTTFTRRSQKFGQWIDPSGTVYGVGFNSEAELTEFIETFHRLQRDLLMTAQPQNQVARHLSPSSPGADLDGQTQSERSSWNATNTSEMNGRASSTRSAGGNMGMNNGGSMSTSSMQQQQYPGALGQHGHQQLLKRQQHAQMMNQQTNGSMTSENGHAAQYPRSQSMFGMQTKGADNNMMNDDISGLTAGKVSPDGDDTQRSQSDWQKQINYENERLKQALEESSKNAGIWHNELLNLRTNNVKLTQALQESRANVEKWQQLLDSLRDENEKLKLRIKALESTGDSEKNGEYKKDFENYVEEVQSELQQKDEEIEQLQRSIQKLELATGQNVSNENLRGAMSPQQRQKVDTINAKLEASISELSMLQRELAQTLDKP